MAQMSEEDIEHGTDGALGASLHATLLCPVALTCNTCTCNTLPTALHYRYLVQPLLALAAPGQPPMPGVLLLLDALDEADDGSGRWEPVAALLAKEWVLCVSEAELTQTSRLVVDACVCKHPCTNDFRMPHCPGS